MMSLATARLMIRTKPVFVASLSVIVGSYLAWIGQMGMQFVFPAQARRFRYGCELRAAGTPRTRILVTGSAIPRNAVSAGSMDSSALPISISIRDGGIFGIGYL